MQCLELLREAQGKAVVSSVIVLSEIQWKHSLLPEDDGTAARRALFALGRAGNRLHLERY